MQTDYPPNAPWQHAQQQQYPVMPPQPPAPQPNMVWMRPVANDHSGLSGMGGLTLFYALLNGFFLISSYLSNTQPIFAKLGILLFALLIPATFFAFGIKTFVQARAWHAINLRRQWAAYSSAAGVPLAEPQPFPNIEALPLPFKIKLKSNWLAIFALLCLVVVMFSSSLGYYYLRNNFSFQGMIMDWLTNSSTLWLVSIVIFAGYTWLVSLPQSIQITAEGVAVRHPMDGWFNASSSPRKQFIPWSDIRLFAIREGKPGAFKMRYELSSPLKVVTFARIVRPRWWALYRPAPPFGEYNAEMNALLALISARTGLLLYDVR